MTDSNLPLAGPYTGKQTNIVIMYAKVLLLVFGRSFVIYSNTGNTVLACGNILPEVMSDTQLELSFPTINDATVDNQ